MGRRFPLRARPFVNRRVCGHAPKLAEIWATPAHYDEKVGHFRHRNMIPNSVPSGLDPMGWRPVFGKGHAQRDIETAQPLPGPAYGGVLI